jgi:hypothetical protein
MNQGMKILIAYDGSEHMAAFADCLRLSRAFGFGARDLR